MRPMSTGQLKSTIKDILPKDNLCHPNLNSKGNMPIPGRNYMTWSREFHPLRQEQDVPAGPVNCMFEDEHR
jgi:hypothetical protein